MSHFVTARAAAGSRVKLALLVVAGSFGCVLGAGIASADTVNADAPSRVVRYSTEALTSNDGVRDLYRRIQSAAKQVCPDSYSKDLHANELVKACRQQAVANAIHQINNSQLAALHAGSSKSG
jgi:UrcA family protein